MTKDPTQQEIKAVLGAGDGNTYIVGTTVIAVYDYQKVTRIVRRDECLGSYDIVWFDVFIGDKMISSVNAQYVQEVVYVRG